MLRGFTDSTGVEWRVWEVFPSQAGENLSSYPLARSSLNGSPFAAGWLCFESTIEKRRLAPIPAGWQSLERTTLEEFLARATPVPLRGRRGDAPGAA